MSCVITIVNGNVNVNKNLQQNKTFFSNLVPWYGVFVLRLGTGALAQVKKISCRTCVIHKTICGTMRTCYEYDMNSECILQTTKRL